MSEFISENQPELNIENLTEEEGSADVADQSLSAADAQEIADNQAEAKWYVVHTNSNYENKVKDTLLKSIKNTGMEKYIFDVRVPEQQVTEIKRGKFVTTTRKIFPGYVLVQMIRTNRSWYVVRNTRGVTGFVGPNGEPIALTAEEVENMINPKQLGTECDLAIGESVLIQAGQFVGQQGEIVDIDKVLGKVLVKLHPFANRTTDEWFLMTEVIAAEEE